MNPAKISIPDCTLDTPVKKSSGKISFCLLPCLHNNERLQVKLATKIQNFFPSRRLVFSGNNSSGRKYQVFQKPGNAPQCFGDKKKIRSQRNRPKFCPVSARSKSEQEKIYAKIYPSKLPNSDFSCRFWEVCDEGTRKKPISKAKKLVNIPLRGQVVFSVKHLFCGNVKAITCIVDEVLVEEIVQTASAFDEFEDRNEDDE